MEIAEQLKALPQLTLNLRYKLYRVTPDTTQWERIAREKLRLRTYHVRAILEGEELPDAEEQERAAEWCGASLEDLLSAPTYPADREGMTKANIAFLLDSLGHGGKKHLAEKLKVRAEQLSRWRSGSQTPHAGNMRDLLRFFALDPDTDVGTVPLFLVNHPIHAEARKKWLVKTIQETPPEKLALHFESMRKLLEPE
jgi:transcriptional regulator with XRE-family HTH domain